MSYPYAYAPQGAITFPELLQQVAQLRAAGKTVVTTNGCFDLLHMGHVSLLTDARAEGDVLIVGLNSDAGVSALKGPGRPLLHEADRAGLLCALECVDFVVLFDDPVPNAWLAEVAPDVHCKAGDYTVESMPEAKVVMEHGGRVAILPFRDGTSTSLVISRVVSTLGQTTSAADTGSGVTDALFAASNLLRQTAYKLAGGIDEASTLLQSALATTIYAPADCRWVAEIFGREVLTPAVLPAGPSVAVLISAEMAEAEVSAWAADAVRLGVPAIILTGDGLTLPTAETLIHLSIPATDPALIRQAAAAIAQLLTVKEAVCA